MVRQAGRQVGEAIDNVRVRKRKQNDKWRDNKWKDKCWQVRRQAVTRSEWASTRTTGATSRETSGETAGVSAVNHLGNPNSQVWGNFGIAGLPRAR